ncbi:hypothetical protein [Paramaledivibacter caminithermalis]|uniref:TRASH domain-containing protein n=1 Tax=Paramaledivibacter caminithermalis (strain DSM 15212 / CIP 107654 / DViRD3) TaxID=1121301 RepID=A0A1M6M2G0_PARC5|nr:hypothetical protein [Paramaledivibacter caminithermalis]SHJ77638.1 hypothetical protein SAMN02745912_01048 [Paramaledivibacter caminithermalis DSM 15212]
MLTKEQKEEILKLRKKGYGYKSIASILKVKRDDVRDLCKKYGLTGYLGYGESLKNDVPKKKEIQKQCLYCGEEINTKMRRGRKSKFCSDKCRRTWWNENQDKKDRRDTAWYSFVCKYCGKDFKAYGNKNRKFCSRKCARDYRYGSYREKTGYETRLEKNSKSNDGAHLDE